jgi:hypothetical protein
MTTRKTIKINNKEYNLEDLSSEAKVQIANVRVCDAELRRLKAMVAINETAKAAYSRALLDALPKVSN